MSESDEEFDDTRIETPRALRNDISHLNSSAHFLENENEEFTKATESQRTSINIPLRDSPAFQFSQIGQRSKTLGSTNGTPKRRTFNEHVSVSYSLPTESKEVIPSETVELPSNKGYGGSHGETNNQLVYSSPIRKQSSRRPIFNSPPSNLQIQPLRFDESLQQRRRKSSTQKFEVNDLANRSVNRIQLPETELSTKTEDIVSITKKHDKETPSPTFTDKRMDKGSISKQNSSRKDGPENKMETEYMEISRANLLERVNQTLDSISSPDHRRFSSPRLSQEAVTGKAVEIDSSSSDSDAFVKDLNIVKRNRSPILGYSTPKIDVKGTTVLQNKEAINSELYSDLRGESTLTKMSPETKLNPSNNELNGQIAHGKYSFSHEWSPKKWKMLFRIVQLNKISIDDAMNSQILIEELGCTSKHELRQRINFLLKFDKLKRKKVPNSTNRRIHKD
ncbi:uncharacterized protein CANTADRAFT_4275 [Suhomyces tanzawaensis NRRL Y-17324]|uniref:Uncharacterized protein n=1 Tax=Suhomyces tanzawaensis NRRL Y-17324 TaxID=984487 RepID=A0A1E4SRW2_9ASCO|nr:uncharacterized protein CANTADRAFT_4275 [Suhomyces tanzawaensis NRRL Y-17324]ODV82256.1 hypothetical protein CANTADRAFT_4275 [Suhomyces tanzawaensis NRRL Y-17324]